MRIKEGKRSEYIQNVKGCSVLGLFRRWTTGLEHFLREREGGGEGGRGGEGGKEEEG